MNQSLSKKKINEIILLLRDYKANKSKVNLYTIEIEGIKTILEMKDIIAKEDEDECIEGMSLQSLKIDDVPKNKNNLFQSKTESVALDYLSEMCWSLDKKQLRERMNDLQYQVFRMNIKTRKIEAMLEVLNREQKFIIEQYYIEGFKWPEVLDQLALTFNIHYTMTTIYKWRDKALSLIEKVY